MPIPQVATEALADAMARFDRDFRDVAEWADWEQNRAHLYAIEQDGQRYPVKQIVSMATGMPVSEFSGGEAAGSGVQRCAPFRSRPERIVAIADADRLADGLNEGPAEMVIIGGYI